MSLKKYYFYPYSDLFKKFINKNNCRKNSFYKKIIIFFVLIFIISCTFLPERPKPTVQSPRFNISSGVYTDILNVSISSSTGGAKIIYTTDGSNPDESNGLIYSSAISVYKTTTIKAVAVKDLWNNSSVVTGQYTIIGDIAVKHGTQILSDSSGNYDIVTNTLNNDVETTFIIENVGNSLFVISDVTSDATSDFYSIVQPASMEIPSGLSVPFTVKYKPLEYGMTIANIIIYSDDLDDGEYIFTITGLAEENSNNAEIDVRVDGTYRASGYTYNFGTINVGDESSVITIKIENNGTTSLQLTGDPRVRLVGTNSIDFNYTVPDSGIIQKDESDDFTVKFVPLNHGTLQAEIQIPNNDSDESLYIIYIEGNGVDNTGPDTSPGTLTVNKLRSNKLTLNWTKAVDDVSPQSELEYLAYYSESSSMTTVSDIETNGTAVGIYTEDISSVSITGLDDDTDYYFNVIVRDELNNKSCYTMKNQRTKEKVHIVYNINSSGNSNPSDFAVFNGSLYFGAEGNLLGKELWKYDDNNDPINDQDINPGSSDSNPSYLTVYNTDLYFGANDGSNGQELWKYDGVSSPSMVYNISSGSGASNPEELIVFNSKLYFRATEGTNGIELWEYNGSDDPSRISDIYSGGNSASPEYLTIFNSKLYFRADNGSEIKLWSYDGISTLAELDVFNPMHMEVYNNLLHLNAFFSIGNYYNELASFTGSGIPTIVYDINSNNKADSFPSYLTEYDGDLYFTANDGSNGVELWVYDGVSNPSMVYDINTAGDSNPAHLIVFNGNLYFSATDGSNGVELWEYTGSGSPTMVKDINTTGDSNPQGFTIYNNNLYFSADDNINGIELWRYEP